MAPNNKLAKKSVLGGEVSVDVADADALKAWEKARNTKVKSRKVKLKHPTTGREITVPINQGASSKRFVELFNSKKNQTEKDEVLAMYLMERGKESASFLAELFAYKGQHAKVTNQFKTQMRFDYEVLVSHILSALQNIGEGIRHDLDEGKDVPTVLQAMADRFVGHADNLAKQVKDVTEGRMREKGYGVYLDKQGRAFSVNDKDFESAIERDKRT